MESKSIACLDHYCRHHRRYILRIENKERTIMIWLQLLYVYLKIGIFGFGGGYAMLSLIQKDVVMRYHWISLKEFTDIVAISQMTPGPIGINSATYIGYTAIHNAGYSPQMAIL